MLGISADKIDDSRRVVEKHALPFDLLCDTEIRVIREYGLQFREPFRDIDIALPANFLVDREGRIAWSWIAGSVQDRADPAVVRLEVDKLLRR